jgi:hypothetical protein
MAFSPPEDIPTIGLYWWIPQGNSFGGLMEGSGSIIVILPVLMSPLIARYTLDVQNRQKTGDTG